MTIAPVRASPDGLSEQVTQALLGEPLEAIDRRAGWTRIKTAYGYEGWISDFEVEEGEGEPPERAPGHPSRSPAPTSAPPTSGAG